MDDVIFAGTATRPPRDFAEVSILVERDSGDAGGSAGESEVTRRIERGTGSAYRIDGRDVRAKDVALLFADAATGAHSPALVSQGRIGAVIAAKPTERRQMLEEAAGIAGLHVRRKDAEQKLRATEANLARLGEILSEQESRAAALRRQARAAERYRAAQRQDPRGRGARSSIRAGSKPTRRHRIAGQEAHAAAEQVAALQGALGAIQAEQDQAAAALAKRRAEVTALRESGHDLAHKLATARARHDTVVRRLEELDRLDSTLTGDIRREEALKGDAAKAIRQLEEERAAIEQRLVDGEAIAARIGAELSEAETESRGAEAGLADLLARQAAMRAERRVAEAALEAARAQFGRTEAERDRLAGQLDAIGSGQD